VTFAQRTSSRTSEAKPSALRDPKRQVKTKIKPKKEIKG
jgi:hypothetical protein